MEDFYTTFWDLENNKPLMNKWFKGGYNYPYETYQEYVDEKEAKGIAELVIVKDPKPTYDVATQIIERDFIPDFTVENDFNGELHVGWKILDKSQEEIAEYQQRRNEDELREQEKQQAIFVMEQLKNSDDPVNGSEVIQRLLKVEKIVFHLIKRTL